MDTFFVSKVSYHKASIINTMCTLVTMNGLVVSCMTRSQIKFWSRFEKAHTEWEKVYNVWLLKPCFSFIKQTAVFFILTMFTYLLEVNSEKRVQFTCFVPTSCYLIPIAMVAQILENEVCLKLMHITCRKQYTHAYCMVTLTYYQIINLMIVLKKPYIWISYIQMERITISGDVDFN